MSSDSRVEMTPEIKEMIKLAAKAMGYLGAWTNFLGQDKFVLAGNKFNDYWNPLSPADSHALMCELEIDVEWGSTGINARGYWDNWRKHVSICEPYTTDRAAACRMAVLRVAAELGKQRKGE